MSILFIKNRKKKTFYSVTFYSKVGIVTWLQGIPIKMVAAGAEHTAAVTEDGELFGWGWGRYGNLGLGDRNDRLVPQKVSSVDVCSIQHSLSLVIINDDARFLPSLLNLYTKTHTCFLDKNQSS